MRSGREKRAIGKIELASSQLWIVFDVSAHVNYHIVQLTRMWHFGIIRSCLNAPEWEAFESWRHITRDELGYRSAGENCWGRKRNIYQEIRTVAEARWQTWLYMKVYIKPGMKIIDICETLWRNWFDVFFVFFCCCWGGIPLTSPSFKTEHQNPFPSILHKPNHF